MGFPIFDSLSGQNGLNQHVQNELLKLTQKPKDSASVEDSCNRIIQLIRDNAHLLTSNHSALPEIIVFLKSAQVLKDFTKNNSPILERQELKKVITQATQHFTNTSENTVTSFQAAIEPLKTIDEKLYYQTLARWLDEHGDAARIGIDLNREESLLVASYLTRVRFLADFPVDLIEPFLSKAKNLTQISFVNYSLEGELLEKFCSLFKSSSIDGPKLFNGSTILSRKLMFMGLRAQDGFFVDFLADIKSILEADEKEIKEIDWSRFEKYLQTDEARQLIIEFSEHLRSNSKIEKLLLKYYPPNDPLNVKIYHPSQVLESILVKRYPQHQHEIESMFAWIDERNIDFDELIHYFEFDQDPSRFKNFTSNARLNCVKNVCDRFPEDPVHRLYLYAILERTINILEINDFEILYRYFDLLAVPPICGTELDFYEGMLNDPDQLIYHPLHVYQSLSSKMMAGLPKPTVVIFLCYLRLAPSEEKQRVILRNLEQMNRLGILDRFLDLFGENNVTGKFLSEPNIFIGDAAVDESTIVLFAMVKGYHYYRKKKEMESFDFQSFLEELQKPSARCFVELYSDKLLKDYKIKKYLVRLYPPDQVENRILYQPNFHLRKNVLYLDILPATARETPDEILDLFEYAFDRIDVQFYGQPGIDEGGLGRQLFSQTIQGVITGNSPHINFQRCDDGKWRPSGKNSEGITEEESHKYLNLGRLIGSALMNDYPLGQLFNDKFLKALLAFSQTELNAPLDFYQKISTLDHPQLLDFINQNIDVEPISFKLVETILLSENQDQIFDSARELNAAWDESLLSAAIQNEEMEEVKTIVRRLWSMTYKCDFEITHQIAQGIEDIIDLQEFKNIPFEAFSQQLQGVVSSDIIKTNLIIESVDPAAKEAFANWLHEWLDEHQNEPQTLGNLIQTFTGARAVLFPIHFRLLAADANGEELKALFAHTCFNIVDVPIQITREGLREVLDSYGRGEHLDFNQR